MFNQEFLDKDFRHNRPIQFGIPMSDSITLAKHQTLLPADVIKGKHILDIGSFIAQTGDWCLNNGAASYTGVEINKEFHDIAMELMEKYHHPVTNWTLINASLEEYLAEMPQKYDIVFCWNVIFGHNDHSWVLRELGKRADHVIVGSRHPKAMWNGNQDILPHKFWHDLEYNIPYQEWQTGSMTQTFGVNASVFCTSANSSIGAMKVIMELEGFRSDIVAYEKLKESLPNDFGMFREIKKVGFFVIEFFKDQLANTHAVVNQLYTNTELRDKNYVDWLKP